MKGSSGKRQLVQKCVSEFIFSERTRFVLDGTGYQFPQDSSESKFIKFQLEKSPGKSKRKMVFRCIYKMMKNFHSSLN